jgi:hypothetical protein
MAAVKTKPTTQDDAGATDDPFPQWVEVVDSLNLSSGTTDEATGIIEPSNAVSGVLGCRLNISDVAGMKHALEEAFPLVADDEGHLHPKWRPRSFSSVAVQAGFGKITGAQASLLVRTTAVVERIVPVIERMTPLSSDADSEDVAAIRSLIVGELRELQQLFGNEGGPVPQRVNMMFQLLMGDDDAGNSFVNPQEVHGQLGQFRSRLGLEAAEVNTMDEEERLTDFHVVVNDIDTLRLSWLATRTQLDRQGHDFLGPTATQLQRALACVASSARHIERIMDLTLVDANERLMLMLPTDPRVSVAELLGWIEEFASRRAFDVLRDSGKDGVFFSIRPTLGRLRNLVTDGMLIANIRSTDELNKLPPGFKSNRVQTAIEELSSQIEAAFEIARRVGRYPEPEITAVRVTSKSVDAAGAITQDDVSIVIEGAGFVEGASVSIRQQGKRRKAASAVVVDVDTIAAEIAFDSGDQGDWEVVVTNPDGGYAKLNGALKRPPHVAS